MMNSKYLFIHLTLIILFLTFPVSSSHPATASPTDDNKCQCTIPCPCTSPANNNGNPSLPQTPPNNNLPSIPSGDSNKLPKAPSDSGKPPQVPSDSGKPLLAPSDSGKPPQAPSDGGKPPQAPSDGGKPPQPPSDSGKPLQPSSDSGKPLQPPSDSGKPLQASSDSGKPPQPPSDSGKHPQPPSDSGKPPQPLSDSDKLPKPPSDSDKPTKPPSDSDKSPSNSDKSPSNNDKATQAPGNSDKSLQPPGGNDKSLQPPVDSNKPTQPTTDSDRSPQPPSDSEKPPQPPGDNDKSLQPPSISDQPPQPLSPNDSRNQSPGTLSNGDYKGCFSKVFAFGDSYTDTGNAYAMGGLQSFVGSLISRLPGYDKLGGHRQSNGRLVVDFLCEKLAMPYLPPYKQASSDFSSGANFAVGGSTSFSKGYFPQLLSNHLMWKGNPLDFQVQVEWFLKFKSEVACRGMGDSDCKAEMEKSLFWVGEIGGSDYARTFGTSISHKLLTDLTLGHVSKIVTSLLDSGAKYIVVQGLPPLGCCPLELFLSKAFDRDQMGCSSICNSLIQAHNDYLQTKILEWQKQYPDCIIAYADYWSAYKTILQNYKKYNFQEPFKACCGAGGPLNFNMHSLCGSIGTSTCKDPSSLMHWDGIHLTEAMHKHITDLFLNQGYCKPSFTELVKKKMGK